MASKPKQGTPSFFKILMDPSAPYLPLPPDFVSKHLKNKIPENPTLTTGDGEYSWQLKIKKIGGNYCFAHGWNNVVKDTHLGFGDFLVFWLIHQSTFQVSIFGPNGCEKELASNNTNLQCDCCGKARNTLNVKSVVKIEEDDDSTLDVKNVAKVDDDGDEEEDDGDEDDDGDDDSDDEDDGDDDDDDDDDGDGDGDEDDGDDDGDDPFFQIIISDKTHKHTLRFPREFVRDSGIDNKTSIALKDLQGRQWLMTVHTEKTQRQNRYYLSSGWRGFRQRNKLSEGDICLFKFVARESKLTLAKVIKKEKKDESQSSRDVKPHVLAPGTERVKRKRGRPPLSERQPMDIPKGVKRKRGRPPLSERQPVDIKSENESVPVVEVLKRESVPVVEVVKRERGRPSLQEPCVIYF